MWSQALGRAPAGRVPDAAKGEAARDAAQIQLGTNLEASAAQLLQFLFEVRCGMASICSVCWTPATLRSQRCAARAA